MSFIVERILNAQLYITEENEKYWVFTVKWLDNEHHSVTLEPEFHPVFEKDPLILKRFWDSHGIDPDTYALTSLIPATEAYINETKANQAVLLSRKPESNKRGQKRTASPFSSSTSQRKRGRSISTTTTTTTTTTNDNDNDNADDDDDISRTPVEDNLPTVITVPRYSVEPIQIDSDTYSDADEDQQTLSFEQLNLSNGDYPSNRLGIVTTTNRDITPAWSLPPIAVLNDLPDFDDSDIVEETISVQVTDSETSVAVCDNTSSAEAPSTGDGPPASFSSSEAERREVDDILIVVDADKPELLEPEHEPELPKSEQPEPEIISISSDDDDLYADPEPEPEPSSNMPDTSNTNTTVSMSGPNKATPSPRLLVQQPKVSSPSPVSPAPLSSAPRAPSRSASLLSRRQSTPSSAIPSQPKPSSPLVEQARKHASPPISNNRSIPNTSASPALKPSEMKDQSILKRDYPGFILRLENDSRLPLYIKDDRGRFFRDFITAVNDDLMLSVHGYYLHDDITKLFQNSNHLRSNKTRGFARIFLEARLNSELKNTWTSFSNDLYTKSLCLILFVPDAYEALLIFASQSKAFGRSISAPSWALGIKDGGLVIARVTLHQSDLCFKRQFR